MHSVPLLRLTGHLDTPPFEHAAYALRVGTTLKVTSSADRNGNPNGPDNPSGETGRGIFGWQPAVFGTPKFPSEAFGRHHSQTALGLEHLVVGEHIPDPLP